MAHSSLENSKPPFHRGPRAWQLNPSKTAATAAWAPSLSTYYVTITFQTFSHWSSATARGWASWAPCLGEMSETQRSSGTEVTQLERGKTRDRSWISYCQLLGNAVLQQSSGREGKEAHCSGEEQTAWGKTSSNSGLDFGVIQCSCFWPQQISRKYCQPETEIIIVYRTRPNRWVSCVKRYLRGITMIREQVWNSF